MLGSLFRKHSCECNTVPLADALNWAGLELPEPGGCKVLEAGTDMGATDHLVVKLSRRNKVTMDISRGGRGEKYYSFQGEIINDGVNPARLKCDGLRLAIEHRRDANALHMEAFFKGIGKARQEGRAMRQGPGSGNQVIFDYV